MLQNCSFIMSRYMCVSPLSYTTEVCEGQKYWTIKYHKSWQEMTTRRTHPLTSFLYNLTIVRLNTTKTAICYNWLEVTISIYGVSSMYQNTPFTVSRLMWFEACQPISIQKNMWTISLQIKLNNFITHNLWTVSKQYFHI